MQYRYLKLRQPFRKYSSDNRIESIDKDDVVHGSYGMLLFDKDGKIKD